MEDLVRRGQKSGVVAGFLTGIILTIWIFFLNIQHIDSFLGPPLFFTIVVVIGMGLTGGILIGGIFGSIYGKIPTEKSIYKALIFLSIFFIVIYLVSESLNRGIFSQVFPPYSPIILILMQGILLGYFWDKFRKK